MKSAYQSYHTERQMVPIAKILGSRDLYQALNCGKSNYLPCTPDHLGPGINQQQGVKPNSLEDLNTQQRYIGLKSFHAVSQEDPNDLPWDHFEKNVCNMDDA